jgi:hypothetical protein
MTRGRDDPSQGAQEHETPQRVDASVASPGSAPRKKRKSSSGVSSFVTGCAGVATALATLILMGLLVALLVADHVKYAHAVMVRPTSSGVVVQSAVDSSRRVRGKLRNFMHREWPRITVEYTVDGAAFQTDEIAGYGRAFLWRPTPEQVVAAHPMGTTVRVRYDRDEPSRGAVDFGPEGWQLWELLVLLPAIGGVSLLVHEWLSNRRERAALSPVACREDAAGRSVVRMSPSTPARWAVKGLAIGTGAAMLTTLLWIGRQPTIATVGWALLAALATGVLAAFGSALRASSGRYDLAVDALRRTLILPPSVARAASLEEGVPFAEIASIIVLRTGPESSTPQIRVSLHDRRSGPSTIDLPPTPIGDARMEHLAAWLRRQVGLGAAHEDGAAVR